MQNVLNWIMNNYHIIIITIVAIVGVCIILFGFLKLTPSEQKKRINLILLDACIKAEAALGSKTGKAKRAQVYAALKEKMPIITLFLSEARYDEFLDTALEEMKDWFSKNAAAAEKIGVPVE